MGPISKLVARALRLEKLHIVCKSDPKIIPMSHGEIEKLKGPSFVDTWPDYGTETRQVRV
jgi:hypothetical protein